MSDTAAGLLHVAVADGPARGKPTLWGLPRSIWTVFAFEFRKSRTWKRVLIWLAVSAFPAVIIFLMRLTGEEIPKAAWMTTMFITVCELVILLNAMLWVSPLVQAELEGKTWLYVVTRPYGRFALVIGKMLNGLVWTLGAALIALGLAVGVGSLKTLPMKDLVDAVKARLEVKPKEKGLLKEKKGDWKPDPSLSFRQNVEQFGEQWKEQQREREEARLREEEKLREFSPALFDSPGEASLVGFQFAVLIALSSLTYASLFCAIGCLFPKRAMLLTFSYTLIFEVVIAFIPALVNKVTIQYHLRCLFKTWVELGVPVDGVENDLLFSNWPASWHVGMLLGMAAMWQGLSLWTIHSKQYVMTDEA